MKKAMIGYQIYSAREDAEKDLFGTLKKIAEMGYDGVEFAGFYHYTVDEIKKALKESGLVAISAHVPLAEIEKDMFKTISDYKAIGCKYIAVPYTDDECRPGGPRFAETIRNIYKFGRLCREAGIQLLYHNHDFEFTKISGMYGLDFIYEAVDACTLKTEIDTCWVEVRRREPRRVREEVRRTLPGGAPEGLCGREGRQNSLRADRHGGYLRQARRDRVRVPSRRPRLPEHSGDYRGRSRVRRGMVHRGAGPLRRPHAAGGL